MTTARKRNSSSGRSMIVSTDVQQSAPQSLPQVLKPGRLWIGGEWQDAASGETFEVMNPALGEPITTCAKAGPADVDRAVQAARQAFRAPAWAGMSPAERQRILWNLGERMRA